jgi:hypothetical protein
MNISPSNTSPEPGWRTYLKAAAFLTPPVAIWALSSVFVFPKLKQVWVNAGFADSTLLGFMRTSDFCMRHGALLGAGLIALLLLVEWRKGRWWPRYRRASVGTLVFLLNSAVLVLIWVMFCLAVVVAPALRG